MNRTILPDGLLKAMGCFYDVEINFRQNVFRQSIADNGTEDAASR